MVATGVDMVGTVLLASDPVKLFGSSHTHAKPVYRRLARAVHPDRSSDPRAADAFRNLERLWNAFNGSDGPTIITSRRHAYELGEQIATGDLSDLFLVTWDAGHQTGLLKLYRSPKDTDLAAAEVRSLRALREVPEQFSAFHLDLIDTFRVRNTATHVDRTAVVVNYLDGFTSLAETLKRHPNGLDGRSVAWIFRRLLVAIGTAHDVGIVHGSVTPEHVMIRPEDHGLVLVGWPHSVKTGEQLRSVGCNYGSWLTDDHTASSALDIRFAAKTMQRTLRGAYPLRMSRYFGGISRLSSLPAASQLLREFNELLEEIYGARTFSPGIIENIRRDT